MVSITPGIPLDILAQAQQAVREGGLPSSDPKADQEKLRADNGGALPSEMMNAAAMNDDGFGVDPRGSRQFGTHGAMRLDSYLGGQVASIALDDPTGTLHITGKTASIDTPTKKNVAAAIFEYEGHTTSEQKKFIDLYLPEAGAKVDFTNYSMHEKDNVAVTLHRGSALAAEISEKTTNLHLQTFPNSSKDQTLTIVIPADQIRENAVFGIDNEGVKYGQDPKRNNFLEIGFKGQDPKDANTITNDYGAVDLKITSGNTSKTIRLLEKDGKIANDATIKDTLAKIYDTADEVLKEASKQKAATKVEIER